MVDQYGNTDPSYEAAKKEWEAAGSPGTLKAWLEQKYPEQTGQPQQNTTSSGPGPHNNWGLTDDQVESAKRAYNSGDKKAPNGVPESFEQYMNRNYSSGKKTYPEKAVQAIDLAGEMTQRARGPKAYPWQIKEGTSDYWDKMARSAGQMDDRRRYSDHSRSYLDTLRMNQRDMLNKMGSIASGDDSIVARQADLEREKMAAMLASQSAGVFDPAKARAAAQALGQGMTGLGAQTSIARSQEQRDAMQQYAAQAAGMRGQEQQQFGQELTAEQAMRDWDMKKEALKQSYMQMGLGEKYAIKAAEQELERLRVAQEQSNYDNAIRAIYGISGGGTDWGSIVSGIGGLAGGLASLFVSDKNAKENIVYSGAACKEALASGNIALYNQLEQQAKSAATSLTAAPLDWGAIAKNINPMSTASQASMPSAPDVSALMPKNNLLSPDMLGIGQRLAGLSQPQPSGAGSFGMAQPQLKLPSTWRSPAEKFTPNIPPGGFNLPDDQSSGGINIPDTAKGWSGHGSTGQIGLEPKEPPGGHVGIPSPGTPLDDPGLSKGYGRNIIDEWRAQQQAANTPEPYPKMKIPEWWRPGIARPPIPTPQAPPGGFKLPSDEPTESPYPSGLWLEKKYGMRPYQPAPTGAGSFGIDKPPAPTGAGSFGIDKPLQPSGAGSFGIKEQPTLNLPVLAKTVTQRPTVSQNDLLNLRRNLGGFTLSGEACKQAIEDGDYERYFELQEQARAGFRGYGLNDPADMPRSPLPSSPHQLTLHGGGPLDLPASRPIDPSVIPADELRVEDLPDDRFTGTADIMQTPLQKVQSSGPMMPGIGAQLGVSADKAMLFGDSPMMPELGEKIGVDTKLEMPGLGAKLGVTSEDVARPEAPFDPVPDGAGLDVKSLAKGLSGIGKGIGALVNSQKPVTTRVMSPQKSYWRSLVGNPGTANASADFAKQLFSDEKTKEGFSPESLDEFMEKMNPVQFNYKEPFASMMDAHGRRTGVLADDVEKSDLGDDMVKVDPGTGMKMLDTRPDKFNPLIMASLAHLHKRLSRVEGGE